MNFDNPDHHDPPLTCAEYQFTPVDNIESGKKHHNPPRWAGPYAQAWYLRWVAGQNADLSRTLHQTNGRKPYTLGIDTRAGWLRLTSVDRAQAPLPLLDAPPESYAEPLRLTLLGSSYQLKLTAQHVVTFTDLLRTTGGENKDTDRIETIPPLHFRTPTLFRSDGIDSPLPTPELVFGSLVRYWDAVCPLPLPIMLRPFVRQYVTVGQAAIRTWRVHVPHKAVRVGFTGRVQFQVTARGTHADPFAAHLLAALARFAVYSGVGVGAAAGFGAIVIDD